MSIELRFARPEDAELIIHHIRALAIYEKAEEQVKVTASDILRDGFGDRPFFEVILARFDGEEAGFALFFYNYSTWQGKPGLYLEDLFVKPELRGNGVGTELLAAIAQIALDRGCGRFQWSCLDWNQSSIDFYESLGAEATREWIPFRLEGPEAIARVAARLSVPLDQNVNK